LFITNFALNFIIDKMLDRKWAGLQLNFYQFITAYNTSSCGASVQLLMDTIESSEPMIGWSNDAVRICILRFASFSLRLCCGPCWCTRKCSAVLGRRMRTKRFGKCSYRYNRTCNISHNIL